MMTSKCGFNIITYILDKIIMGDKFVSQKVLSPMMILSNSPYLSFEEAGNIL